MTIGLDLSHLGEPCVCDHAARDHRDGGERDSACKVCTCQWFRSVKRTQELLPGWDMGKCTQAAVQERYDGRKSMYTCLDCGRVMQGDRQWQDQPEEVFCHFRRSYAMRTVPHLDSSDFRQFWDHAGWAAIATGAP